MQKIKKKSCTYEKILKKSFFRKNFFATGLVFERFLASRSRFFEKVNVWHVRTHLNSNLCAKVGDICTEGFKNLILSCVICSSLLTEMVMKKELKVENELSRTSSSMISKKKYKGVRMRRWGSWVSEIRAPNQKTRIWLGSYSTPEAAARAYDAALLCLKGPTANLNFSQTQYDHDYSTTIMSPKSIQKIAAVAAATTTPPSPSPSYSSSVSYTTSTPPPTQPIEEDDSLFSANDPLDGTLMSLVAPWYNFDSPSYDDVMFDTSSFFEIDQSSIITKDVCEEESERERERESQDILRTYISPRTPKPLTFSKTDSVYTHNSRFCIKNAQIPELFLNFFIEVFSRSFGNSYIPENPKTPKPLTFSKNRLRGAKNRSILSPVAKKKFRKNNFFFSKILHMGKFFFFSYMHRILIIMNVLESPEVGFLKGITVWEI
ncbi:hypothetical protein LXL04_039139 [Taraxacum kok-saghyz]